MLWVGPTAERERIAAVAEQLAGELLESPDGFARDPQGRPDAAGIPASHGHGEEAPAGLSALGNRGTRERASSEPEASGRPVP